MVGEGTSRPGSVAGNCCSLAADLGDVGDPFGYHGFARCVPRGKVKSVMPWNPFSTRSHGSPCQGFRLRGERCRVNGLRHRRVNNFAPG